MHHSSAAAAHDVIVITTAYAPVGALFGRCFFSLSLMRRAGWASDAAETTRLSYPLSCPLPLLYPKPLPSCTVERPQHRRDNVHLRPIKPRISPLPHIHISPQNLARSVQPNAPHRHEYACDQRRACGTRWQQCRHKCWKGRRGRIKSCGRGGY
jgi:hypothetical protein